MYRKRIFIYGFVLMVFACLPLTSLFPATVQIIPPGHTAELQEKRKPFVHTDRLLENSGCLRWDLLQIKAPEAWPVVSGGKDVIVAVLDTGIDAGHNDLKDKVIGKTNFTESVGIDTDRGHGTHVAGIIAGAIDNFGIAGLAYNCSLLDVKIAENDGSTNAQKLAQGIVWAVDHGAKIINISIVISKPYTPLENAANYAWEHGCIIVAAAGNSCTLDPVYPAAYPHVISVAATDKSDSLAEWSNRGGWVSVAAPGVDIYSTLPDQGFGYKSGSSFSTALVSGEAALIYLGVADLNGDGRTNDEVFDIVLGTSDKLEDVDYQQGRINAYRAAVSSSLASEASN